MTQILEKCLPWIALFAGALLLVILLAVLFARRRKRAWLWIIAFILAFLAVVFALPQTRKIFHTLKAYEAIKTFLAQPESVMELDVQAKLAEQQMVFNARVERSRVNQIPVTAITQNKQTLYYAQGVIFLADGTAYQLGSGATDYSGILDLLLPLYATADIQASKGTYTIRVPEAQAEKLLEFLLPQAKTVLRTNDLTVELVTRKGKLSRISFSGSGNLTDMDNAFFYLFAGLQVVNTEPSVIPQPVQQALITDSYQTQQIYSPELATLIEAYQKLAQSPAVGADVRVDADFGLINLAKSGTCYRWKTEETDIYAVETGGLTVYTAGGALCDANGHTIQLGTGEGMDIPTVIGLVYGLFTQASFDCQETDTGYLYTVTLTEEGMRALVAALLPQAAQMDWTCEQGTAMLTVADGEIRSLQISCGGSTTVAVVRMGVSLSLEMELLGGDIPALPEAVKEALNG